MQRVASGWRAPHALVVNPSATYHVGTAPTSDHPDGRSALQDNRAYMRTGQGQSAHLLHHGRVLQARQAHRQPPSRLHLQRRCLDIADLCAAATGSQLMPQADRCLRWSTAQWTGCRLHTLSDQHVLAHKCCTRNESERDEVRLTYASERIWKQGKCGRPHAQLGPRAWQIVAGDCVVAWWRVVRCHS
jgi:hypothetical protein